MESQQVAKMSINELLKRCNDLLENDYYNELAEIYLTTNSQDLKKSMDDFLVKRLNFYYHDICKNSDKCINLIQNFPFLAKTHEAKMALYHACRTGNKELAGVIVETNPLIMQSIEEKVLELARQTGIISALYDSYTKVLSEHIRERVAILISKRDEFKNDKSLKDLSESFKKSLQGISDLNLMTNVYDKFYNILINSKQESCEKTIASNAIYRSFRESSMNRNGEDKASNSPYFILSAIEDRICKLRNTHKRTNSSIGMHNCLKGKKMNTNFQNNRARAIEKLEIASNSGNVQELRDILNCFPDIPLDKALLNACKNGQLHMVKFLIEISPSLLDYVAYNAFPLAADNGHIAVLDFFLNSSNTICVGNVPISSLFGAAVNGHENCVRFLFDRKPSLKNASAIHDELQRCLAIAAIRNHEGVVFSLVENFSDEIVNKAKELIASGFVNAQHDGYITPRLSKEEKSKRIKIALNLVNSQKLKVSIFQFINEKEYTINTNAIVKQHTMDLLSQIKKSRNPIKLERVLKNLQKAFSGKSIHEFEVPSHYFTVCSNAIHHGSNMAINGDFRDFISLKISDLILEPYSFAPRIYNELKNNKKCSDKTSHDIRDMQIE